MTARLPLAAAVILAVMAAAAHWRQMEAHAVTHTAMLSEHTAAKKAHREALATRTIAADLYKHWTGFDHPAAPREG